MKSIPLWTVKAQKWTHIKILSNENLTVPRYFKWTSNRNVPWCPTIVIKFFLNLLIIVLALTDLIAELSMGSDHVSAVHFVSAAVRALTFSLSLYVAWECKKRGVVASSALFFFWTVAMVCDAITFR